MIKSKKGIITIKGVSEEIVPEFFGIVSKIEDDFQDLKVRTDFNKMDAEISELLQSMLDYSILLSRKSQELEKKIVEIQINNEINKDE